MNEPQGGKKRAVNFSMFSILKIQNALIALCLCAVLCLWAGMSSAVIFQVTTSEEFQAALAAASENGADDEIILAAGPYLGGFKFLAKENYALTLSGAELDVNGRPTTLLDAQSGSFALLIDGDGFNSAISISRISLANTNQSSAAALFMRKIPTLVNLHEVLVQDARGEAGIRLNTVDSLKAENLEVSFVTGDAIQLEDVAESQLQGLSIQDVNGRGIFYEINVNRDGCCDARSILRLEKSQILRVQQTGLDHYLFPGGLGNAARILEVDGTRFEEVGTAIKTFVNGEMKSIVATDNHFVEVGAALNLNLFAAPHSNVLVRRNRIYGSVEVKGGDFLLSNGDRPRGILQFTDNLISTDRFSVGGAFINEISLVNNTIVGLAGGLDLVSDDETRIFVQNNIFWGRDSEAVVNQVGIPEYSVLRNNLIAENSSYWDISTSNLSGDPKFFDPARDDYHLAEGSPLIDAGLLSDLTDDSSYDLDGNPRVLNGAVDIGAYERSTTALHPADTNGDNSISQEEFDAYNLAWRENDKWTSPPEVIPVDFVTRAGFLRQKGGTYKNIGVGKPQTWVPVND